MIQEIPDRKLFKVRPEVISCDMRRYTQDDRRSCSSVLVEPVGCLPKRCSPVFDLILTSRVSCHGVVIDMFIGMQFISRPQPRNQHDTDQSSLNELIGYPTTS